MLENFYAESALKNRLRVIKSTVSVFQNAPPLLSSTGAKFPYLDGVLDGKHCFLILYTIGRIYCNYIFYVL